MAIKITKKKKKGEAHITKEHKNGSSENTQEDVDTGQMLIAEQTAQVHVEMGNTVNTGNYESSKFAVGITMPCDVDDVDSTYEFCQNWANDRLAIINEELQESIDG